MVEQPKLKLDLVRKPVDHNDYRSMIGSLMYVTSSRPDIKFATYTDHAGCHLDRKSTSGSVQFLGDKLVCWSSKKQNCVSISTAESEYVVVSSCCAQVLRMRTQLTDYGFFYDKVPIYCDSKSAIAISCNPVQYTRTNHIDVRPNGDALRKCILNGPYIPNTVLVQAVAATADSPAIPKHTTVETPMNMSPANKAHFESEIEVNHLILTGIGDEIYSTVDACQIAQEICKGKEIAKPSTPPSESASEEDSDPEQAQRDKDMQKNLALIEKYFKSIYKPTNKNLRTSSNSRNKNVDMTPRENVGSSVVHQSRIQCFNCKEFGHFAKECIKPKRVKDFMYHKEKMFLCKQVEKGVPLQAEQYDWLADIDEEIDEQELEAHYSYMTKIQENDSFIFVHELKQEMHADLKYVESIKKEIDELESNKAEFSNIYDMILQECVSNEVMCSYLLSFSDLDAIAKLQCLYLHKVKECDCLVQKLLKQTESVKNDTVWNEQASNVFRKEREQYIKIQDLKAQLQNKNIAISEVKKLIEKGKGKSMETKFDKPSVVRQPNAQRILKPSVLVDSDHFACVIKMLNDVNARTKKPNVVPISTKKPKGHANKSVATTYKKQAASKSTTQKPKSYYRMLYEKTSKTWKWWIEQQYPSGYKWVPKTKCNGYLKLGMKMCRKELALP
nr:hypothetical protein [Tanacetum cinerariifolium]